MQHNIFTTMRSMKIMDGCKGTQVYAIHPSSGTGAGGGGGIGEKLLQQIHDHIKSQTLRSKSVRHFQQPPNPTHSSEVSLVAEGSLLPYGLPMTDLLEPKIEPTLRPVDFVETLSRVHRRVEECPQFDRSEVYLEQCSVFRGLSDPKLFRRSLRSARQHAVDVHTKVVLASWLRYERREDELIGSSSMDCCGRNIECPRATLSPGYDPESVYDPCSCACSRNSGNSNSEEALTTTVVAEEEQCSTSSEEEDDDVDGDMSFCIDDSEIRCSRFNIASLSRPFKTMLYGGFIESRREKINFSRNGFSVEVMTAAEVFSRTKRLSQFQPDVVLELLSLANRFCCEEMKSACDAHLASLVCDLDDALLLIEYGLEETAYLLVAACLQVFLRELPGSMQCSGFVKMFCSPEGRDRLAMAGHASFVLYRKKG